MKQQGEINVLKEQVEKLLRVVGKNELNEEKNESNEEKK